MIDLNATMAAQILNFLILALILRALAYKPVAKILKQRSDSIKAAIDKADSDKRAAEKLLADYNLKLADAHKQAQAILDKAEFDSKILRENEIADTKKEIERLKIAAKAEILNDRKLAFAQLKEEIVALSLSAAEKIVAKNLSSKDNDKLVSDFIAALDKNLL